MKRLKFAKGATAEHTETSLCRGCRYATTLRGEGISQEATYCRAMDKMLGMRVTECSSFDDKSKPTLHMMREIAWTVTTDKKGHKIGFVSPQEAKAGGGDTPTPADRKETLVLPDGSVETYYD
jgi:hypothetical protein